MYIVTEQKYLCCFLKYIGITSVVHDSKPILTICLVTVHLLIACAVIIFTARWIGLWIRNQIAHRFT